MAEYIEREAALKILTEYDRAHIKLKGKPISGIVCIAVEIEDIPAADVRPVVKGFNKLKDYPTLFECSACGWECDDTMPGDTATYNFCPNCGADMRPTSMSGANGEES